MLGGTNNHYNCPVLFGFKWPNFSGCAPFDDPDYTINNKSIREFTSPWFYVRFPNESKVLDYEGRGIIEEIYALPNHELYVSAVVYYNGSNLMYFFDTSFTIKNMNVNDIFHYELRPDQGSNAWDAVDRDTFMDDMSKIKFWNGETWVDTFAVNV